MGTKSCRRCEEVKPLEEFYVHKKMADGYLNVCKECVKRRVRRHRKANDSVREYDRWRYQTSVERKQKSRANAKRFREENPLKYKAHYMVSNAIRGGKLSKKPCVVCGSTTVHAHHADYSKPLDVTWLCPRHHQQYHHGKE